MPEAPDKKKVVIIHVHDEEHGGHHGGSWKVAYADFVTALMALFLLLWLLMALKPQQKVDLSRFFNPPDDSGLSKPPDKGVPMKVDSLLKSDKIVLSPFRQIDRDISERMRDLVTANPKMAMATSAALDGQGTLVQISSRILFPAGQASLAPEAALALDMVADILTKHNLSLRIRGHADDAEAGGSLYPSAWELSTARATAALRYLVEKRKVDPRRLEASGLANTQPLVPDNTPDGQVKNRRLEFLFTGRDQAEHLTW